MLKQPSHPRRKQEPGCHLKAKVLPLQVTECLVHTVRQVTHLTTKPIVVEQNFSVKLPCSDLKTMAKCTVCCGLVVTSQSHFQFNTSIHNFFSFFNCQFIIFWMKKKHSYIFKRPSPTFCKHKWDPSLLPMKNFWEGKLSDHTARAGQLRRDANVCKGH